MSLRTVTRFALVGLLVTSVAAPAAAQNPGGRVRETRTGSFMFLGSYNTDPPVEVAPMPRVVPVIRTCAEEEIFSTEGGRSQAGVAPMPRDETRVRIPELGPLVLALDFDFPLNKGPFDKGQTVSLSVGVFGLSVGVFDGPEPTPEVGPVPRAKKPRAVEIEFGIDLGGLVPPIGPAGFDFTTPAVAPTPRQVPARVQGEFELFFEDVLSGQVFGRPAARAVQPGYCGEDNFCVPVNGPTPAPRSAEPTNPMLALGACRRDDNGTWWVEVIRVPQPKFAPARQVRPCCEPAVAPMTKPACCAGSTCCDSPTLCRLKQAFGEIPPALSSCTVPRVNHTVLVTGGMVGITPAAPPPFAGTWARELDGMVVAATLSPCGEELKLCMTQNADGHTLCLIVTADCKIMKEGLVHGVITGVDLDVKRDPKATGGSPPSHEAGETSVTLQQMVDCPFSFRVKRTAAGLMVSNLKLPTICGVAGSELAMLGGMFKPCKDGAVPVAKPLKTYLGGMTLPTTGRYFEHYPQYFSPDPQFPLPRELASQEVLDAAEALRTRGAQLAPPPRACGTPIGCGVRPATLCPSAPQTTWNPPKPVNVPGNEFGMMADVFGQMLGAKQAPPRLPPAPVMPPVAVQTLGYVVPPPPPMLAPTVSTPPLHPAKPSLTGTWVREVGPVVYVVKIAHDHLTITATGATEIEDGTTTTEGMILTGDYHLSRDGTTLVGLITGVDAILGGDVPENIQVPHLDELSRLQKAYTDKPFAMGVRVYADALVIGNVRLPQVEESRVDRSPLAILGGRYRNAADKPLPKPKAMKPAAPRSLPAEPTVGYPVPGPYYTPTPVNESPYGSPVPRPTTDRIPPPFPGDAPRLGPPIDDRIPPPAPRATEPAAPPMTVPTLPVVEEPKAKKKKKKAALGLPGILLNQYSNDPDIRMQQLLYESDGPRQIQNEWRRFWFNDQPSHLTPERIHGGIIN